MCPYGNADQGCRGPHGNVTTTTCGQCLALMDQGGFTTGASHERKWDKGLPNKEGSSKIGIEVSAQHYVRSEIFEIQQNPNLLRIARTELYVEQKLRERGELASNSFKSQLLGKEKEMKSTKVRSKVIEATDKIRRQLQSSDLTINFDAWKWFSNENTHKKYAQEFEKSVDPVSKRMLLKDGGRDRNADDNRVTNNFRQVRMMNTGPLVEVRGDEPNATRYAASNASFEPGSRQKFAALNYGRRNYGAAPMYGCSYFKLKDHLKGNALYYPGDTILGGIQHHHQMCYHNLETLLGMNQEASSDDLKREVFESCYEGKVQMDSDVYEADRLIEAHLYGDMAISPEVIEKVYISFKAFSATFCPTYNSGEMNMWQNQARILENVQTWCRKFHIPFVTLDQGGAF